MQVFDQCQKKLNVSVKGKVLLITCSIGYWLQLFLFKENCVYLAFVKIQEKHFLMKHLFVIVLENIILRS